MAVDSRPHIERKAQRALLACVWAVAVCAALGGSSFAYLALHHTKPKEYH